MKRKDGMISIKDGELYKKLQVEPEVCVFFFYFYDMS